MTANHSVITHNYLPTIVSRQAGIPELWTQELDSGLWTQELDSELWTLDPGRWTLDAGFCTLDPRRWTLDAGL